MAPVSPPLAPVSTPLASKQANLFKIVLGGSGVVLGVVAPTYADVYLALDGGLVERRVVPVVPGVGVGSLAQQQRHHLKTNAHGGFLPLQQQAQGEPNALRAAIFSWPPTALQP